jgi:hypothetical protein
MTNIHTSNDEDTSNNDSSSSSLILARVKTFGQPSGAKSTRLYAQATDDTAIFAERSHLMQGSLKHLLYQGYLWLLLELWESRQA